MADSLPRTGEEIYNSIRSIVDCFSTFIVHIRDRVFLGRN